jgi:hypothetical protein
LAIQFFEGDSLVIVNPGGRPLPIILEIEYDNHTTLKRSESAKIWTENQEDVRLIIPNGKAVRRIVLNSRLADQNRADNFFPRLGDLYQLETEFNDVTGLYKTSNSDFGIIIKDGILQIKRNKWDHGEILIHKEGYKFQLLIDENIQFTFRKDDTGTFSGIDLEYLKYGSKWRAKKIL